MSVQSAGVTSLERCTGTLNVVAVAEMVLESSDPGRTTVLPEPSWTSRRSFRLPAPLLATLPLAVTTVPDGSSTQVTPVNWAFVVELTLTGRTDDSGAGLDPPQPARAVPRAKVASAKAARPTATDAPGTLVSRVVAIGRC